jgi:hypothetical protein
MTVTSSFGSSTNALLLMRHLSFILVPLLFAFGAPGCVAVPVPHPEYRIVQSRRVIKPEEAAFVRPGATTRAELLCTFGEPDFWWDGERVLAYQWTTSNLGIAWAAGAGSSGGAGFIDVPIHHFLVVTFDPDHRVHRMDFHQPPIGWLGPQFLRTLKVQTQ